MLTLSVGADVVWTRAAPDWQIVSGEILGLSESETESIERVPKGAITASAKVPSTFLTGTGTQSKAPSKYTSAAPD